MLLTCEANWNSSAWPWVGVPASVPSCWYPREPHSCPGRVPVGSRSVSPSASFWAVSRSAFWQLRALAYVLSSFVRVVFRSGTRPVSQSIPVRVPLKMPVHVLARVPVSDGAVSEFVTVDIRKFARGVPS